MFSVSLDYITKMNHYNHFPQIYLHVYQICYNNQFQHLSFLRKNILSLDHLIAQYNLVSNSGGRIYLAQSLGTWAPSFCNSVFLRVFVFLCILFLVGKNEESTEEVHTSAHNHLSLEVAYIISIIFIWG